MENKKKRAIVWGSSGMDGGLMVEFLRERGYEVLGVNIRLTVSQVYGVISDMKPHEIYNFAGFSNTFDPYLDGDQMIESNLLLPKNILESINLLDREIKFFHASSCLIFGKDRASVQSETTHINPSHPYGIIKAAAQQYVKMYREEKDIFTCSAIYFPHEYYTRGENFFTKKICMAVARIKNDSKEKIKVSQQEVMRDWGWAPDYIEAAWRMLQHHKPIDFVVGTGALNSLNSFIRLALGQVGLDYDEYTEVDETILRKNDLETICANNYQIQKELGWKPKHFIKDIVKKMVEYELEQLKK